MNKIFKTFLAASVSLLAVACNLDQVNDVYTAEGNEPSMLQTVFNETELDATIETIAIPVVRSNSSEAATVNLTATLPAGITVSGTAVETLENGNVVYSTSVSFAAGEAQTGCVLNISEMAVGSSYKGTVAIAEGEKVNENKVTMSTAFTLAKAYTWVSLGQGEWFDNLSLMSSDSYGIQSVEVLKADGEDLCYVNVSLVDKDGNPVPVDSRLVKVKVTGAGSFKAISNGDPTCLEPFQQPQMHLFSGQLTVLVQAASQPGDITMEVSGKGVKKAIMKIKTE